MEILDSEKRRARNLIWNAAADYSFEPDFKASGAAFFEGNAAGSPAELEAAMWIAHVMDDSKPLITKPEQAYVVTQILEAIYESAKSGKPVYFD